MKNSKDDLTLIREDLRECDGASYIYRLTSRKSSKVASYGMPLYSIRVEMLVSGKRTECELSDVFADIGKALSFYNRIVDGLATPLNLPYILEDKIYS